MCLWSEQWAVGIMGCRNNGSSEVWVVGIMTRHRKYIPSRNRVAVGC